jgi:hypothetical protein
MVHYIIDASSAFNQTSTMAHNPLIQVIPTLDGVCWSEWVNIGVARMFTGKPDVAPGVSKILLMRSPFLRLKGQKDEIRGAGTFAS